MPISFPGFNEPEVSGHFNGRAMKIFVPGRSEGMSSNEFDDFFTTATLEKQPRKTEKSKPIDNGWKVSQAQPFLPYNPSLSNIPSPPP